MGTGTAGKELKEHNNTVIGVDISEAALSLARGSYDACLLNTMLDRVGPVDLAFSHLCMQHNHEEEVFRILKTVELTAGGCFSFQFAALNHDKTKLSRLILKDLNKAMLHFYSEEKMQQLVEASGKTLVSTQGPFWFGRPFYFDWFVFRVQ